MTRFSTLVVVLVVGLFLLVGGTIAYGRQLPNKIQSFGFDLCDDKPCFKGLVSGMTLSVQAERTLMQSYHPIENDYGASIAYSIENGKLASVILEDGRLDEVHVGPSVRESVIELNDVLLLFGIPCGVTNYYGSDFGIVYAYMRADFDTEVNNNRISPESPLVWMEILDPQIDLNDFPVRLCNEQDKGVVPWYGFESIAFYKKHGLNIWQSK